MIATKKNKDELIKILEELKVKILSRSPSVSDFEE